MTDPKVLEADIKASQYLGDYNQRIEAGKHGKTTDALYRKAQFWLDRYNKLVGNA